MRTFELNIFIDCRRNRLYNHLTEPLNMIGLQPQLTEINALKEGKDESGILLRPFNMVVTYRLAGLPRFRNKIHSVIALTRPRDELEIRISSKLSGQIIFKYVFKPFNDQTTQITQTVQLVRVNKLLAGLILHRAKHAQRVLLSNLKVRMEKK